MGYINLVLAVFSAFVAGLCFSDGFMAAGSINVLGMCLNMVAVAMHLESR